MTSSSSIRLLANFIVFNPSFSHVILLGKLFRNFFLKIDTGGDDEESDSSDSESNDVST